MNLSIKSQLGAALFVGASALTMATQTHAAVIYTNLTASPLSVTNSIDGIYINVVTGVTGALGSAVSGWDINPYNNGAGLTFYGAASPSGVLATGTPGTGAVATALALNAPITSAGQYNQFQTLGTAFQGGGNNYLGFRFLNESTGATNYGWLLVSSTAGTGFPSAILGYAYENTGLSILAGQTTAAVPEPATYAMFGMGLAAAALAVRRRRNG